MISLTVTGHAEPEQSREEIARLRFDRKMARAKARETARDALAAAYGALNAEVFNERLRVTVEVVE